ncbi:unnamed protein product, partial [Allacma fusca]
RAAGVGTAKLEERGCRVCLINLDPTMSVSWS